MVDRKSTCAWGRPSLELWMVEFEDWWRTLLLTTKCEGVRMPTPTPHPLTVFLLWAFWWFIFSSLSAVCFLFKENYWESPICCSKHFFCPTTTYSGLCSSDHPYMKILILVGFLGLGEIYSEKNLRSVGHLHKLCKLFPQALIYLKGAMLIYRLMPP